MIFKVYTQRYISQEPTGPICSRSQSDASDHEQATGGLNHHHRYAQCTNKFHAVRMQQLWSILDCRQDSGGDAKERSPRRDALRNGVIRRSRNGSEKVDSNYCDAEAGWKRWLNRKKTAACDGQTHKWIAAIHATTTDKRHSGLFRRPLRDGRGRRASRSSLSISTYLRCSG